MGDMKKDAPAPAQEPTAETQQAAIDALKLVGNCADLMTEILTHQAAKNRDPATLRELYNTTFPVVVAGLISSANEPGGMQKLEQMQKLLARWDA